MRRSAGLGYGQVFLIIFGFLLTSGLIFLFGIWVGRDVAERRLVQEERVVRGAMQPPPTPNEEAKQDVDQSFYEQLKQKAYVRMQETAAAAAATAPPSSPVAHNEQLPTPALAAAAPAAPAVTPTVRSTPRLPSTPAPTRTAAQTIARPTAKPTSVARPQAPEPPPQGAEGAGAERAGAGFTVQVSATTSIEQAIDLARRLKAKGYDAYTVQAPLRGQAYYRVRVGRYASREKAKEMENRLRDSEGLGSAYVAPQ